MPTLRERTSTSSATIAGTSSSRTTAARGSSKISAFMPAPSSLIDQNLDFIRRPRGQPREGVRRTVQGDATRDDAFDGKTARRYLRRDPVEVVHPVAPGTDDREIVERPEIRLDVCLPDEKAGLRE